jgi:DNA-directed RNA polymerase specialized sigma24 family protein
MVSMRDADSGDLLLAAAGDVEPVNRIVGRWKKAIYSLFERFLEPSAAAEATVEVFHRLYRSAARFDPATPFPVWIYGFAAKTIQEQASVPAPSMPVQRLKESAAARVAYLRSAVRALPGKERAAFLLTRIARLPIQQTAAATGTSDDETRRLLVKAFENLANGLGPVLEAPDVLAMMGQAPRGATPEGGPG